MLLMNTLSELVVFSFIIFGKEFIEKCGSAKRVRAEGTGPIDELPTERRVL
jgi:hypothetical protein